MFGVDNITAYLQGLGLDISYILVTESPEKPTDPTEIFYLVAASGEEADDLLKQAEEQLDRPDTHPVVMDVIEVFTRVVKVDRGTLQIGIKQKQTEKL